MPLAPRPDTDQLRLGVAAGVAAYGSWGLIPLYFKTVRHVAPVEVLAHRALWSFAMLALVLAVLGRWSHLLRALRHPRVLGMLGLSTLLIGANWLLFIYAVSSQQVLQASLGYFINPLVNVLLGVVFLHERLRRSQLASIALAALGVALLTVQSQQVPSLALLLAGTFGLYALVRKLIPLDGLLSLAVETLLLAPLAVGYLGWASALTRSPAQEASTLALLLLSGPVTTVPLLCFGGATRRLRLSTMGVLQYLSPTLQFLVAVVLFREPFSAGQLVSFSLIWLAVALYATDSCRASTHASAVLESPE